MLGRMGAKGARVQKQALQDARRRTLTFVNRDIRDEFTLKSRTVSSMLRSPPVRDDSFTVTALRRGLGIENFQARVTKKGVSAKIYRRGARRLYKSAFRNAMLGQGVPIFEREIEAGKRVWRLGIERVYGPTVSYMLDNDDRLDRIQDFTSRRLFTELRRRYQRLIQNGA